MKFDESVSRVCFHIPFICLETKTKSRLEDREAILF